MRRMIGRLLRWFLTAAPDAEAAMTADTERRLDAAIEQDLALRRVQPGVLRRAFYRFWHAP